MSYKYLDGYANPGVRIVRDFPSNANYTAVVNDYRAAIMEFTATGTPITADRDVILPNIAGLQWIVYNNTTASFNLVFKVSGQTGVTVAYNKRCIVYCDGTDIVRATPDNP